MFGGFLKKTWFTLAEVYKEFSLECTIHGIKYTTTTKSTARLFWIIVLISSFCCSLKLVELFYEHSKLGSVSTLIMSDHLPTAKFTLPAITICSGDIAIMEKIAPYLSSEKRMYMPRGVTPNDFENSMKYLRDFFFPKNHFSDELDKLQQILTANRMSIIDLLDSVSPNCTDILLMCQYERKTVPCESLLKPVVTNYGLCCSFNYHDPGRIIGSKSEKKLRSSLFGDNFVLSVLVKSYTSDERLASIFYGDGVKILVHEAYTIPGPTSLQHIATLGHETIVRIGVRYLTSSDEIVSLPADIRGCFTSSSTPYPYRADNCYKLCRESVIYNLCGCVPFFATRKKDTVEVCSLSHLSCLARISLYIHQMTLIDPECNCLPNCRSTNYDISATSLTMSTIRYSPAELYKKAEQYGNTTILHFTHDGQSGIVQQRELVVSQVNLISNLGGVFALFLGCSFISAVEVFYFFCVYFVQKLISK